MKKIHIEAQYMFSGTVEQSFIIHVRRALVKKKKST